MHTRHRGSSSSKRPYRPAAAGQTMMAPGWVSMTGEEAERLVLQLQDQGLTESRIGMVLRDRFGVPSVRMVSGKRMDGILKAHGKAPSLPEDLAALLVRAVSLHKHLEVYKNDIHNRRNLHRVEAKIQRLVKYYQREERLPLDWKYSRETAEVALAR